MTLLKLKRRLNKFLRTLRVKPAPKPRARRVKKSVETPVQA